MLKSVNKNWNKNIKCFTTFSSQSHLVTHESVPLRIHNNSVQTIFDENELINGNVEH